MELAFDTKAVRRACESQARAERAYGIEIAQRLRRRLADLAFAPNVGDLVAGRPRPMQGNPRPRMIVTLGSAARLVFCVNHNKIPVLKSGAVDWARVSRIKILAIEVDDA